jgi:FtsP/CotA-like multicopper oxidase with cupredoxin domain
MANIPKRTARHQKAWQDGFNAGRRHVMSDGRIVVQVNGTGQHPPLAYARGGMRGMGGGMRTFLRTAAARLLGLLLSLLSLFGPSIAGELVDIAALRPCSLTPKQGLQATGNCSASDNGTTLSIQLTARQIDLAHNPEDAPKVTFDLPAGVTIPNSSSHRIVVDGLMLYNDTLAPEVWRLGAGNAIRIRLINRLAPGEFGATNLHTHGLLVPPTLDTRAGKAIEPVGDTVYVCTIPEGTDPSSPSGAPCGAHHAFYGPRTSEMNYRLQLPPNHPEGLFWYHPHVHMNAREQVGAGLSGLIFVKNGPANLSGGTRLRNGAQPIERFLMLKDIQLGNVVDSPDPPELKASYLPAKQHDAGLCGATAPDQPPSRGACFSGANGWLFTVNGQLYPNITIKDGGKEIWRIANTSADMTYDLALVERGTARPLRMQLLARDGVAAAQEGSNGPILVERLLLMPSARVEVAIDRNTSEGLFDDAQTLEATLKSYGYYTGGDAWPAVDLASVLFEPAEPPTSTAPRVSSPDTTATSGEPRLPREIRKPALLKKFEPMVVKPWQPGQQEGAAPPPVASGTLDKRSSSPAQAHGHVHAASASPLPLPSPAECTPLGAGEERIIALAIDKTDGPEKFKIGAVRARRTTMSPAEWDAAVQKAIDASRQFGDGGPLLCAHAGTTEVWNIVNKPFLDNQETHNFHIHQTKFEVLDVADPHGRIELPRGGPQAKRLVDNYPVPIGGSIRIRIRFVDQQAGGRFVFHCHILEHEDKGMMAEIEVVPRSNTNTLH